MMCKGVLIMWDIAHRMNHGTERCASSTSTTGLHNSLCTIGGLGLGNYTGVSSHHDMEHGAVRAGDDESLEHEVSTRQEVS